MGMVSILVMWPGLFEQTFVPPSHRSSKWNLTLTGPVVSEEKMFKKCGRRRRSTYPISSPLIIRGHSSILGKTFTTIPCQGWLTKPSWSWTMGQMKKKKRCQHYMIPRHCAYFCCCASFGIMKYQCIYQIWSSPQLFNKILSINIILKSIKGHNSIEKFRKIMCISHNIDHIYQCINKMLSKSIHYF